MSVTLQVVEVGRKDITAEVWDAFAQTCGASFRCCYKALTIWQLDDHLLFQLRRFEIYTADNGYKIGQCAIGKGRRLNVFTDAVQLLPQYHSLWAEVMTVLLIKVGPGHYRYGSQWNTELPREEILGCLEGIEITSVESLVIQAIEFNRWASWNGYLQHVSKNARRNAARALNTHPMLQVTMRRGLSTVLDLPVLVGLHLGMKRRKQLTTSPTRLTLRLLARMITMKTYMVTAVISDRNHQLAAYSSIEFGANTYYLTGGSERENGGAAWHLLLTMIRRAYDRTPANGKFLMGPRQEQSPGWNNLARSREQCRVSNLATSVILFSFIPEKRPRLLPIQEYL